MIPRSEYPRPQFARENWLNLNGEWEFEIAHGASGREHGMEGRPLSGRILVPFCPESALSGVGYRDFMREVWYARSFTLPRGAEGGRAFLNFGAVDYECEVWVNGVSCGTHTGGYASFRLEITGAVKPGENRVAVCARDDTAANDRPRGKQSDRYASYGCVYTRTTGIWQTVWLEWTGKTMIESVRLTPDAANGTVTVEARVSGPARGTRLTARASYGDKAVGEACADTSLGSAVLQIAVSEKHLWEIGRGELYGLSFALERDGAVLDSAESYFALRTVSFDGMKCLINGRPVFQRLVLDQGFYPDGIYTAPTDDDLKADILRAMDMGFNGARLHQKVFEQRFLYWADKLGYMVWGEFPSWGCDPADPAASRRFLREWLEVLERDYNSPCIVGWCPWNETWEESRGGMREATLREAYLVTKSFDRTRPVIDTSGGYHTLTDVFDVHDYDQDPSSFAAHYGKGTLPIYDRFGPEGSRKEKYAGGPVFVSEYGGIAWDAGSSGWGYGQAPSSPEEFIARYKGLTDALLDNPDHMGLCYTQLTDVEQERNGLYTYDRRPKFDPAVIRAITSRKAACEE